MRPGTIGLLSSALAVLITASVAVAQSVPSHDRLGPELAIGYNYGHSNAPAGGCGCFSLNGGSTAIAIPLHHAGLSLLADISVTHADATSSRARDLTLSTFTAGVRLTPPRMQKTLQPFGEVLVGVAHASGSLVEGSGSSTGNSGAAFASLIGGGIDLRATNRLSLRLIEADYLVTTFDNGSSNHQNNLRLGADLIIRF